MHPGPETAPKTAPGQKKRQAPNAIMCLQGLHCVSFLPAARRQREAEEACACFPHLEAA